MSDAEKTPSNPPASKGPQPAPRRSASTTARIVREMDMMRVGIDAVLRSASTSQLVLEGPPGLKLQDQIKIHLHHVVQRFEKEVRGLVRQSEPIDHESFAEAVRVVVSSGLTISLSVITGLPAVVAVLWIAIRFKRARFADYLGLRAFSWTNLAIGVVALFAVGAVTLGTLGLGTWGMRFARTTSDLLVASRAVTPWWWMRADASSAAACRATTPSPSAWASVPSYRFCSVTESMTSTR